MRVLAAAWFTALLIAIATTANSAESIAIAANARSMQPGELVVLTMTLPGPADSVRLHAFNREIPVYEVTR